MTTNTNLDLTPGNVKEATQGMKSSDLWQVPYDELHLLEGFNVRVHDDDYEAHIESLANSIIANGYLRDKPMSGYVANIEGISRIVITDGHSRYHAIGRAIERGAEITTIPVVTKVKGTSMEDLTVALVTSNSGRPLTPFETGIVCKRLVSYGWDEKAIASKLGVTAAYVSDLLMLQGTNKEVRDLVASGAVSATTAISTVKKHGTGAAKVLKDAVVVAKKAGKKRASVKHIQKDWKSECKRAATDLYDVVAWVKNDKGYKGLSQETKERLEGVFDALPAEPEQKTAKAKK